ncbi:hypothetical protein MYX76_15910 [Desulfobacterota bacterium AH_259_B03_O07]|nr:hypothetical protein [Desulfobacterota bacterium AH_259_B03_O07]
MPNYCLTQCASLGSKILVISMENAPRKIYESPALPLSYAAKINLCRRLAIALLRVLFFSNFILTFPVQIMKKGSISWRI